MRAVSAVTRWLGRRPARGRKLRREALFLDLAANTAWYGLVAFGPRPLARGLSLGAIAGLATIALPPLLGLGRAANKRVGRGTTAWAQGQTLALYVTGGLAAAFAAWLGRELERGRLVEQTRAKLDGVWSKINARKPGLVH
jgi:hypothetical protein